MPTPKKTSAKTAIKSPAKSVKKPVAKVAPVKKPELKTGKIIRPSLAKKTSPALSKAKKMTPEKMTPVKKIATPREKSRPTSGADFESVKKIVTALDEKKAENMRVIFVGEASSIANYFVIATGNSEPHLRALRIAVEKELDALKAVIVGRESQPESGWCVIDAFDVIVHLFLAGQRGNYEIESLWKNGAPVPLSEFGIKN